MAFINSFDLNCEVEEADVRTVQPELRLWPERDPNLHYNAIYSFKVEQEALLAVLDRICASSNSASEVQVELSASTLSCAVELTKGAFGAVAWVALPAWTKTEAAPVRFSVEAGRFYKTVKYLIGQISFVYDRNAAKVHVNCEFFNTYFSVTPLLAKEADDEGQSLGQIHPSDLCDGVRYASVLSQRKSPLGFPHQGLRIAEGCITSGYLRAVSYYASASLPAGLDVTLPREHVVAARSLFGKFRGKINVMETTSRIRLRSPDLEVYWTKSGSWPKYSEFAKPAVLATVQVDTEHLIRILSLFSSFADNLRFEIARGDGRRRLKIFGSSTRGACETFYPVDSSSSGAEEPAATWGVTVNAKDAAEAAGAVRTQFTAIRAFARGLTIESVGPDTQCKTMLYKVDQWTPH